MRLWVVVLAVLFIATGCAAESQAPTSTVGASPSPIPVVGAAELVVMASEATAFADRMYDSWPDLEAFFADLSEDAVFYDANAGDYFVGRDAIVEFWATIGGMGMPYYFPEYRPTPRAVFVSAEDLAFPVDWFHLSPDEPWPDGVEMFLLEGDEVVEYTLWYSDQTIDSVEERVDWAVVEAWVSDYVDAWTSDAGPGSLYAEAATYDDTLFGMSGTGPDGVSQLAHRRFGDVGAADVEVGDVYALSIGGTLIDADSGVADGDIVGIGFVYRWPMRVDDGVATVESLVLCEFGTMGEDGYVNADPEHRIVHERVFHNAELLSSALS